MGGGYQIVAGERRWRASRRAGLSEVPAVIKELTDNEVMEIALIENLQREDPVSYTHLDVYKRQLLFCKAEYLHVLVYFPMYGDFIYYPFQWQLEPQFRVIFWDLLL